MIIRTSCSRDVRPSWSIRLKVTTNSQRANWQCRWWLQVPPHLLGAGAGLVSDGGSIHIQSADTRRGHQEAGLGSGCGWAMSSRLTDYDSSWGHGYLRNAVGIGVVAQGDSPRAGYGPGITLIMTSASGDIAPMVSAGREFAGSDFAKWMPPSC